MTDYKEIKRIYFRGYIISIYEGKESFKWIAMGAEEGSISNVESTEDSLTYDECLLNAKNQLSGLINTHMNQFFEAFDIKNYDYRHHDVGPDGKEKFLEAKLRDLNLKLEEIKLKITTSRQTFNFDYH